MRGNAHGAAEAVAAMKTMRGLAVKVGDNPIFCRDFAVQSAHAAGKIAELLLASGKPELVACGQGQGNPRLAEQVGGEATADRASCLRLDLREAGSRTCRRLGGFQ